MTEKRKLYRDWQPQRRIRQFAKRHGLTAVKFTPPNEQPFIRVWFDLGDDRQVELEKKARKLYGNTRGGYCAA